MEPILTALYILIGILAGTAINIAVEWRKAKQHDARLIRGCIRELKLNIDRVELNLAWLDDYRKAVATDSPSLFLKWFSLTTMLSTVTNQLLNSGVLYDRLTFEEMHKLQGFFSAHSQAAEQRINDQAAKQRDNFNKSLAGQEIAFWETRWREQRDNLNAVVSALKKSTIT
ncbi:MAG TPA: hypothetical protein VGB22_11085 [candidate division Zixibacteria bacterium]|jgi:hypothetical protein